MNRRRVLMGVKKDGRLPAGFQEVEYLESSLNGGQKIQIYDVHRSAMSARIQYYAFPNGLGHNGGSDGTGNRGRLSLGANNSKVFGFNLGNVSNSSSRYVDSEPHTLNLDLSASLLSGSLYVDGDFVYSQTATTLADPTYAFYLFAYQGYSTVTYAACRIFWFKIGDSYDLIPCIRKSDNKPGMYDLCSSICPLTGTPFYINAGTGEFITGNTV